MEETTTATAISATSAVKDSGVSLSSFAHDGERFEPHTYETAFCFRGNYAHVALAEATATLWCANETNGAIDLYSCVTGQFTATLPTLSEEVSARQVELSELPINASTATASTITTITTANKGVGSSTTPRSRGVLPMVSAGGAAAAVMKQRASSWMRTPVVDAKPTALCATASHVWVGYTDGTVAVYDALLLKLVTMGQFHHSPVTAIVALCNGQVVSASADGLLVLWDTEAANFEAVTRVTVLLDAVRGGAGKLCALTATPHAAATRVCCGFEAGAVYSVFLASRPQEQTPAHLLKAHTAKVNDMAVVNDLLFTAAEDHSVCVWYCGNPPAGPPLNVPVTSKSNGNSDSGSRRVFAGEPLDPLTIRSLHTATKLLKRITVKPCVRGLLAERQTRSLWVAYADGLLERWSANIDDDFGVEEIVDNALFSTGGESGHNTSADERSIPATAGAAGREDAHEPSVKALLSLSAVQTMQWLAFSSNGVNRIWYGHKNTLEMGLANSLLALHDVVAQDAEDAAAWQERLNVLRSKEMERKERYICILEQLNEQRVLQRHYERWRRSVLFCGTRKRRTAALAETLKTRAQVQLARRFFGKWASFYDGQQRHMRGYVLSMALSRATEHQHLHQCFVAWQSFVVKQRIRRVAQTSAMVLAKMVNAACVSRFFHQWRSAVVRSERRKTGLSAENLALLAHKAQRQVQQRALRQWLSHHAEHQQKRQARELNRSTTAVSQFAAHYAQLQQQRRARQILQLWRRWTAKKARNASLAAVAALREQQLLYETRQSFFLRWRQRVHARHTRENAEQLAALEVELRRAEAEHGDIFEKLQLQKQLDQLASRQAAEEAQLAHTRSQLAALEQSCAQLRAQQQQRQQQQGDAASMTDTLLATRLQPQLPLEATMGGSESERASSTTLHEDPAAAAASSQHELSFQLPGMVVAAGPNSSSSSAVSGRGHMSANAVYYRSLVDQQRLSPIVLAHMPMEEAVHHVMGQLKGNVVNLYTDLVLFRQVKDRRRAGTSAVGILLEAFGELKRMIVSTVRGASAAAASAAARSGVKATRWPLSMEALDCIPVHQCSNVLSAIKTMVVAYDLLQPEDVPSVQSTCEEIVANADWVFLIARACYRRRKPLPPANNRQVA